MKIERQHRKLDFNRVFRKFTKKTFDTSGFDTSGKIGSKKRYWQWQPKIQKIIFHKFPEVNNF